MKVAYIRVSTVEQNTARQEQALKEYGIEKFSINEVTVNEQNPQAIGFYEHMGFKVNKRTDLDEQGRPYPLLYMKR